MPQATANPLAETMPNAVTSPAAAPVKGMSVNAMPVAHRIPNTKPRLQISGIIPGRGVVMVAVFNSARGFPDSKSAIATYRLRPDQQVLSMELSVSGTLAFAVYQDLDGNGQITRGKFRVPLEPFAFSNGAKPKRKPPPFADAAVRVSPDASQIVSVRLAKLR